ncbi:hypothetical protein niasHT_037744 [Heterodera trifolii]|uniref:Uncharacterized protein n=1 Tax=Heterodera trifolii TaxID=157864 RepID=A0ABD2J7T3_9BILA
MRWHPNLALPPISMTTLPLFHLLGGNETQGQMPNEESIHLKTICHLLFLTVRSSLSPKKRTSRPLIVPSLFAMSNLAMSSDDEGGRGEQMSLKVVLLGDNGTGKTAICCRFAQHAYPQKYTQTSGVDFYSRRIAMPRNVSVLLQLWDVGGHNLTSPAMLNTYIFGAQAVLFVYDVTNSQSFDHLTDWVGAAKKGGAQMEKPFCLALVGNKTDSEHQRAVKMDRHNKFADQNALSAFYVSAKTGDSIDLMFKKTTAEVLGIPLTKADQEWNVVQAQITTVDRSTNKRKQQQKAEEPRNEENKIGGEANGATEEKTATANESEKTIKKSTVCSLQ